MSFSLQGSIGASNSKSANQTSLTLTLVTGGGTIPVRDIIFVFVVKDNTATTGGATTQISVSDPLGNTYTRLGEINVGASAQAGCCLAVFYAVLTTAVPNSTVLTATLGGTTANNDASAMSAFWVRTNAGLASQMRIGTLYTESLVNTTNPANVSFPSPAFTNSGLAHLFIDVLALEADSTETAPTPTGMSLNTGISTGTTGSTAATNVRLVAATFTDTASLSVVNDWTIPTARDICRLGISLEEVINTTKSVSDTITLDDEIAFGGSAVGPPVLPQSASDTITLSDAIAFDSSAFLALSDTLTLVDDPLTPFFEWSVSIGDALCDLKDSGGAVLGDEAWGLAIGEGLCFLEDSIEFSQGASASIGLSDALDLTDSFASYSATERISFADTLALTDSVQRSAVLYSGVSDTLFLADSVQAEIREKTKALSDTLSLIDSLTYDLGTGFVALSYAVSDTLVLDDADVIEAGVSAWAVFVGDHLCHIQDAIQAGHGISFSEAITLADVEAHVSASEIAFSDALTLAEDFRADVPEKTLALSDALTLSDTFNYSAGGDLTRSFAESLTLTESVATFGVGAKLLTDTLALTDALTRTIGDTKPLTDTLALSDATSFRQNSLYAASDSLTLSDSVNAGIRELGFVFSDTLDLTDSFNFNVGGSPSLTRNFSDSLTFTESLATFGVGATTLTDTITLVDSFTPFGASSTAVQDSFSLTDSCNFSSVGARTFAETITLSDTFTFTVGIPFQTLALADALTLSDTLTYSGGGIFSYGFADALAITDAISFRLATSLALNDTISLTDALSVGYGLKLDDQLALLDAWQGSQFIELSLSDVIVLKDKLSFFKSVEGIIPAGRIYCIGMDNRRLEIMHENRVILIAQDGRIVYIDREGNICCD